MKAQPLFRVTLLLLLFGIGICQEAQKPKDLPNVKQDDAKGHLIYHVEPVYPPMAKTAHIQGEVVLHAIIGADGAIGKLQVVKGHPILVQSAMDAVKQWKYQPFMVNGAPVAVETTIVVSYHMSPVRH